MHTLQRTILPFLAAVLVLGAGLDALPGWTPAARAQTPPPAADLLTIDPEQPLPLDPQLRLGQLDNGLTYYVMPHHQPAGRAELRLVVRAGSIVEDDDQAGLAHFVEHMAFNGSRRYAGRELVHYLESLGMAVGPHANAATGMDETVYFLRIPSDDPAVLSRALEILADWAGGLSFEPGEVEKERPVVLAELRSSQGADSRLFDQHAPELFAGSRYAYRRPAGRQEVIESATAADLRRFYQDWYRPDLVAVVAVGDFDPDAVEAGIRQGFGSLRGPAQPRPRERYEIPAQPGTRVLLATDPGLTQSGIEILYLQPWASLHTHGDYRRWTGELLTLNMLNARLAERIRDAASPLMAAQVEASSLGRVKDMVGFSSVAKEGQLLAGLQLLAEEVERLRRHGFTAPELQRAATGLLAGSERAFNERERVDSGALANGCVGHFLQGVSFHGIEYEWRLDQQVIPAITLNEVNTVAQRWLGADDRVVALSVPEGQKLPAEAEALAVLARAAGSELAAYADTFADRPLVAQRPAGSGVVAERTLADLGVTEWTLGNGVRVVLKPTELRNDQVLLQAASPGGLALYPDADFVAAATAPMLIVNSGFGDFDGVALGKRLAGTGVELTAAIDPVSEGLAGQAPSAGVETLLQLVYLLFTAPRSDPQVFAIAQENLRQGLATSSPQQKFGELITRVMTQDHPRFQPFSEAMLAQMDLQRSLAVFRERFAGGDDFTFVLAGNLDLGQLRPQVETWLGGLPATGRRETRPRLEVHPPAGALRQELRGSLEPRSSVALFLTGLTTWTARTAFTLDALGELLGHRLRERLREERGGTYDVDVQIACFAGQCFPDTESEFEVDIRFDCAPQQVEALVEEVRSEIDRLRREGPSAREVQALVEARRRGLEEARQSNGYWLTQLTFAYANGIDPHEVLDVERLIAGLDASILRQAAGTVLGTPNEALFVLQPE